MDKVLGIDTSTSGCAVALMDGDVCLAHEALTMSRGQSEELTPMIERVVAASDLGFRQLDAIAVTRGPGGFTGLRIGLAAARALSLALGIPCIGLSAFDVLRAQALPNPMTVDHDLLIAIESKREEPFVAGFECETLSLEPSIANIDVLSMWLDARTRVALVGDAAERTQALIQGNSDCAITIIDDVALVDARVLAELARQYKDSPDCAPPDPIYLRPPDVTMPGGKT